MLPIYHNGKSFGEACVSIEAYVKEEDKKKLRPQSLGNKFCHSDAKLTTQALKTFAKEQAIIQALLQYDRNLASVEKVQLLPIVHNVKYHEAGFIPDTETYCVKFEGTIYPIEVLAGKTKKSVKDTIKQWVSGVMDN